jgi:hypothetical protein
MRFPWENFAFNASGRFCGISFQFWLKAILAIFKFDRPGNVEINTDRKSTAA